MSRFLKAAPAVVLGTTVLLISACGSSGGAHKDTTLPKGSKGGVVNYVVAADTDHLDPGQTYDLFGFTVESAINRQLYGYLPNDPTTPVPDLATGPPEISPDKRTITVHIQDGARFSPPVNRKVTSADIKYAFERAFSANVGSRYAGLYFQSIEGAPIAGTGPIVNIPGITTPDDHTIVFKLTTPTAPVVAQALVLPITTPVPREYASKFDADTPTSYDSHVVATGPYMVENNPYTGEITGHVAGKSIKLVRNPNWNGGAQGDYRPAYLDAIAINVAPDLASAARHTFGESGMLCCGSESPPASVLPPLKTRDASQIASAYTGETRYIALNTTIKPFDNLNVRKAVIAAFDRNALRDTRGGRPFGDIADGWIPPGVPGFSEAGRASQGASFDFLHNAAGDMTLARSYMAKARKQGVTVTAGGRYAGDGRLLMVGTTLVPGDKTAQVARRQFEALGFKLDFQTVAQGPLYADFCGAPKAEVAICPNVGWLKDLEDPQAVLDPTFDGTRITPHDNFNWPQLNVGSINAAMKAAAALAPGPARNKAWAQIDHMIISHAPGIPWLWDKRVMIASKDVVQVPNDYTATADLSFSFIRKP